MLLGDPASWQPATQASRVHCHRGLGKRTTTCRGETSWMGSVRSQESVSLLGLLAAILDKSCKGNLSFLLPPFCFFPFFYFFSYYEYVKSGGSRKNGSRNQQGTKRTYAQAIRKNTKLSQETCPQETTEPTQSQETRCATPPEQTPNEDEPFLIRTREALWTTTEDLHQSRLLKSSSAVLHFPRYTVTSTPLT